MSEATALAVVTTEASGSLLQWKALALHGLASAHTRRAYDRALSDFHAWYRPDEHGVFSKFVVEAYRGHLAEQGLAPSSINVQLAALRRLSSEAADRGLLAPDVAAGVAQVKGAKRTGVRAGNWLSREQAQKLLRLPNVETLQGKRDQALLALLIGCGLRRAELAALTVEHIQPRDGRWVIVDLVGKGSRVRTVPMADWAKAAIDSWTAAAGFAAGKLMRPVSRKDEVAGESDTPLRFGPADLALARKLHEEGVPLVLVESAFLLASLRRLARPNGSPPLGRIRSLAYFLPVVNELQQQPLPGGYLDYLRLKLAQVAGRPDDQTNTLLHAR